MSIKDELKNIEIDSKNKIMEKLNDTFDVNYDVTQIRIETMEEFNNKLLYPFENGAEIYYRGERINSKKRKLLPTLLRSDYIKALYKEQMITEINTDLIMNFYNEKRQFLSVYKTIYNNPKEQNLYNMLAFAQHYLDVSPFIDFTKSLYVALSFAIKGRTEVKDDIVIYTAFDIGFDDTSNDIEEVNSWLESYNVQLINTEHVDKNIAVELSKNIHNFKANTHKLKLGVLANLIQSVSPTAKLIDIPINDLMKYQQGVFLFLNDFSLVDNNYLTRTVRESFVINKYIISANLAMELRALLIKNTPQYKYKSITNISKAVRD